MAPSRAAGDDLHDFNVFPVFLKQSADPLKGPPHLNIKIFPLLRGEIGSMRVKTLGYSIEITVEGLFLAILKQPAQSPPDVSRHPLPGLRLYFLVNDFQENRFFFSFFPGCGQIQVSKDCLVFKHFPP